MPVGIELVVSVAIPLVSATGAPSDVLPPEEFVPAENCTAPVGAGPFEVPFTVAVSVTLVPFEIAAFDVDAVVVDVSNETVSLTPALAFA